jgi:molybdopterin-binding protein
VRQRHTNHIRKSAERLLSTDPDAALAVGAPATAVFKAYSVMVATQV